MYRRVPDTDANADRMTSAGPSARLVSIDVLRALAVIAVMIRHLPFSLAGGDPAAGAEYFYPGNWFAGISYFGKYGVHLFLVISGFCVHMRWVRQSERTVGVSFFPFWRRRLVRLYPPYFAALLATLATLFVFNLVGGAGKACLADYFGYASGRQLLIDIVLLVFLVQNVNGASHRVKNGPLWALALEAQLYMLYFPFLYLRRRLGWRRTLLVTFVLTMGWRIAGLVMFDSPPEFWFVIGPAFWFAWILGALSVEAQQERLSLPAWCFSWGTLSVLVGLGVLCVRSGSLGVPIPFAGAIDDILFASAFFVLLNIAWRAEDRSRLRGKEPGGWLVGTAAKLGLWSYSIYLTHNLVFGLVKHMILALHGWPIVILGARLLSGVACGFLFFKVVEVYWARISKRIIR